MIKTIRSGTAYIQPGKHRWRNAGSYKSEQGYIYGIFICYLCGVRCDTTAPFPTKKHSEIWNGKRIKRTQPRPQCLTTTPVSDTVAP